MGCSEPRGHDCHGHHREVDSDKVNSCVDNSTKKELDRKNENTSEYEELVRFTDKCTRRSYIASLVFSWILFRNLATSSAATSTLSQTLPKIVPPTHPL